MKYNVTALTPLLVGDGQELSPIDYMVWKDQVNVLDQNRIFKLLARGPRLDSYLAQLQKATKLDFASWGGFAQNFSQRRIPFEHAGSSAIFEKAAPESLFIPTFAANHRGAYLPASALKGALRTGLVFSRWTAATIEKIATAMATDRLPRRPAEAAESAAGASQVRILAAADSGPIPNSSLKVFLTRVSTLDARNAGSFQLAWKVSGRGSVPPPRIADSTPEFAEMAIPGTTISGTWQEHKFLENTELIRALGWRSVPDPKLIAGAANEYAAAQLALQARYAEVTGLAGLAQSIARLQQSLAEAQSEPLTCLLCLGWGAGFVSKTAFLDTDQEPYRKILRTIPAFAQAIKTGLPFPKTRRIVFGGGQPSALPGWVKLQLTE